MARVADRSGRGVACGWVLLLGLDQRWPRDVDAHDVASIGGKSPRERACTRAEVEQPLPQTLNACTP